MVFLYTPMAYPLKFCQHGVKVREKEQRTFAQASERFDVGIVSLMKWSKNIHPVAKRHKLATKIDMCALKKDIVTFPDDDQYERARRFSVSQKGICDAL